MKTKSEKRDFQWKKANTMLIVSVICLVVLVNLNSPYQSIILPDSLSGAGSTVQNTYFT